MAADVRLGLCQLSRFSLDDWKIYRFRDALTRARSYLCYQFGQHWLAETCRHLRWDIREQTGCVVSMAVGEAVNS